MVNMVQSVWFACYLLHVKQFKDKFLRISQVANEIFIMFCSYHQILFTDFVSDPLFKYNAGSSMLAMCFINFAFPNMFWILKEWFTVLFIWLKKKGYINPKAYKYIQDQEAIRKAFLNSNRNNIKVNKNKKKMVNALFDKFASLKLGGLAKADVSVDETVVYESVFALRASRKASIKHIFPVQDMFAVKKNLLKVDMTKIIEEPSGEKSTFIMKNQRFRSQVEDLEPKYFGTKDVKN